jgi:hypothetical protein
LQSGFIKNDSTTNQLVSIYHTFCQALDEGKEVRAIFCDISKAFDRVWHRGLIHKLKVNGLSGVLLNWFQDYLSGRSQRVVLSGTYSEVLPICSGVPQGSILGPLLFLVYINDIVEDINSTIRLFADDTSLYIIVDEPHASANILNSDLCKVSKWANDWLVDFNPAKTESLLISRKVNKPFHPPLYMNNVPIQEVKCHKHLGVTFSSDGSWHEHVENIKTKSWQRISIMRGLKFVLDRKSLEIIYTAFIRPLLEYSDVVWDNLSYHDEQELEKIQLEALRIISGCTKLVSIQNLYEETCFQPLKERRKKHRLTLFYKMSNNLSPSFLTTLVPNHVGSTTAYNLRNADNLRNFQCNTRLFSSSFVPQTVTDWNLLSLEERNAPTLNNFKSKLHKDIRKVPVHFYYGDRKLQIHHTRLRNHCSSLNEHLFSKNIINSPLCTCGEIETTYHYFFKCLLFETQRTQLIDNINALENATPTLSLVLYGDSDNPQINKFVFEYVHYYIQQTKRFS